MSGHSKWSTIKHKKGAKDAKRGQLFAKLVKIVEVAAREGGGDPAANATLSNAIDKARAASVPNDNIERAIKRGIGEVEGANYEEMYYEGYAPGGVALYVQILTDNRNRASSDVRAAFSRNGGNLGEPGSVAYLFEQKGYLLVGGSEDEVMLAALEAGAEDVRESDGLVRGDLRCIGFRNRQRCPPSGRIGVGRCRSHPTAQHYGPGRREDGPQSPPFDRRSGRPRRRPECLLQLRHRRRRHGRPGCPGLALEHSRIGGHIDGVFFKHGERDYLENLFIRCRQYHRRSHSVPVSSQPVRSRYTPPVAGHEARELVVRHRGAEIIADAPLMIQELARDNGTDRVAAEVLLSGVA